MKPWKLCLNKQKSYKLDVRGIIDMDKLKCEKQCDAKRGTNNVNYDFIKMRPTDTKFVCRFSDKKL
jgi:hypothetical protein